MHKLRYVKKNVITRQFCYYIVILLAFFLYTGPNEAFGESQKGNLRVHFIDVGQADSIVVEYPNGGTMLIDAGNNNDSETIISYIQALGIQRLDVVVGTHPHEDHIGSLDKVIDFFEIDQVIMPKVSHNTKTFEDVVIAVKGKSMKISMAEAGIKLNIDSDVETQILAPISSNYEDLNDYSVVIKLSFGQNSFLFTGDLGGVSEEEIIREGEELTADVLKVGHHGSKTATTADFLAKVNPSYAVISVGEENSYGHPAESTLERLESRNIDIYRTDLNGNIVMESDGKNIIITSGKETELSLVALLKALLSIIIKVFS